MVKYIDILKRDQMTDSPNPESTNKKTLFSSASDAANQANLDDLGFDSSIQQVSQADQPKNPKDFFKTENDSVVKNIVDNKVNPDQNKSFTESNKDLLDEFSEIDKRLNLKIDSLEVIEQKKKTTKIVFFITLAFATIAILAALFFNGTFESEDVETPLDQAESQFSQIKSELILSQTKKASILINQLAFQASDFQRLYNQSISEFESGTAISQARNRLPEKQSEINETLSSLEEVLTKIQSNYGSDQEFHAFYVDFIARQLESVEEANASISLFDSEQLLRDSSKLVKNTDLLSAIRDADLDTQTQADLLDTLRQVFNSTNLNYVTDLATFTLNRIELTRMFSELTTIASTFDPNFSAFNIREDSIINFNNYTISANNTVSVTANIQTSDQNLFSLIANLDDAISDSSIFQNISRTTYSKNLSPDGGFTSSVNLDINLETL